MTNTSATEYEEQVAFVQWLRVMGLPHWRTPNETYTKSWSQKNKNKALGVSAGVPDLFVALPKIGLVAIEMKRTKGSVTSQAQKDWLGILNDIPGVEAHICKGAEAAIEVIKELLRG